MLKKVKLSVGILYCSSRFYPVLLRTMSDTVKRFGILALDESAKWAGYEKTWINSLREPKTPGYDPIAFGSREDPSIQEEWIVYHTAAKGDLPKPSDNLSGIVLTGSYHCLSDDKTRNLPWVMDLIEYLKSIAGTNVKVVGGCFGHQVICYTFGGVVTKNHVRKTGAKDFFVLKAEEISPNEELLNFPAAKGIFEKSQDGKIVLSRNQKPYFRILESHGDCVFELPKDSTLLASSPTCDNEIAVYKNMLTYQSHPEFDLEDCIMRQIWPIRSPRLSDQDREESLYSFKQELDSDVLLEISRRWLKSDY